MLHLRSDPRRLSESSTTARYTLVEAIAGSARAVTAALQHGSRVLKTIDGMLKMAEGTTPALMSILFCRYLVTTQNPANISSMQRTKIAPIALESMLALLMLLNKHNLLLNEIKK
jgi:hypothetical protein